MKGSHKVGVDKPLGSHKTTEVTSLRKTIHRLHRFTQIFFEGQLSICGNRRMRVRIAGESQMSEAGNETAVRSINSAAGKQMCYGSASCVASLQHGEILSDISKRTQNVWTRGALEFVATALRVRLLTRHRRALRDYGKRRRQTAKSNRSNLVEKEGPAHRRPFVTFGVLLTF